MKKRLMRASCALFLLLASSIASGSDDPSRYSIAIGKYSDSLRTERRSRYLLSSAERNFLVAETPFQRTIRKDSSGGRTRLLVESGVDSPGVKLSGDESAEYLCDTRFLNLSSPGIREAASRFASSDDPVSRAEAFVNRHITDKDLGIPLLPAAEILKNRSGDCTEHAVLCTALLRSLKIPARAVVGIIYSEEFLGRRNVFVFHMWVEAYRDGRWRLVDATRPGRVRLNRYVAFAYHSLKSEIPLPYLRAIASIRDLQAEYIPR